MKAFCFLWMTILMLPSNEGKSLSVEQHLTASGYPQSKSRIQKRDMDYFYDYNYDYGDYDTPEIVLTIPPPTPPPTKTTEQSHFDGFETFMDGLKKLQEALDNPDYDWGKVKKTPVDSVTDLPMVTPSAETYTPPPDIHELLVLIGILQQLSLSKQRTTTTPSPKNLLESAELVLGRIFHALNVEVPPEERRQILFTLAPKGNEGSVQEAVAEVSQLFQQLFGEPAVSLPPPDMASLDDSAMLLNMTMQLMENIEDEFERKIREEEHRTESSTDHYERLRSIIQELHSLSGGLVKQTTRRQVRPTATPRPTANKPNQELCTLPFVDVAYKVCILPVLDRQLSWHDARQYCRYEFSEQLTWFLSELCILIESWHPTTDEKGEDRNLLNQSKCTKSKTTFSSNNTNVPPLLTLIRESAIHVGAGHQQVVLSASFSCYRPSTMSRINGHVKGRWGMLAHLEMKMLEGDGLVLK
ncbi:uncharacterized protein [Macrobrachium rosenbergii]|uniref:uncharacterized protein n=1 Tax=Macrobrachium rosenbergii TaxID=79674 RepID=UPI0034D6BD7C